MSGESSRVDALIEGADRSSRRPHTSREEEMMAGIDQAMADALSDILRDERDEARHGAPGKR